MRPTTQRYQVYPSITLGHFNVFHHFQHFRQSWFGSQTWLSRLNQHFPRSILSQATRPNPSPTPDQHYQGSRTNFQSYPRNCQPWFPRNPDSGWLFSDIPAKITRFTSPTPTLMIAIIKLFPLSYLGEENVLDILLWGLVELDCSGGLTRGVFGGACLGVFTAARAICVFITNRQNTGLISVDRRTSLLSHVQYPVP